MELWRRLVAWFGRGRLERELDEEMRFHLEMAARKNREEGAEAGAAERAARRRFGNTLRLKEDSREARGWAPVERLAQDAKYALRGMRRNPGFTAVVVAVLALGIGANTAIYSAVNALLLHPYRFPDSDRLMLVEARHRDGGGGTGYRDFLDWRDQNTVFEEMAIIPWTGAHVLAGRGDPQRIIGGDATAGFARVLGIQPALGRFFTPEEDRPGAPPVVLLSYDAWRRWFDGRPDALGRTLMLDGVAHTIIGVMPRDFAFLGVKTCDVWLSMRQDPANSRDQHQYGVVARRKPGVPLARAQAQMSVIAARLEREYPATNKGWGVQVRPLAEAAADDARKPLGVLLGAVVFVLALACVNVAGLLLARASARTREMAIRASLGAGRGRIVRQMLTESVILSLAGGALGIAIASVLMRVLAVAAPEDFALDASLRLDGGLLVFACVLSVVTGVLFGLAPAFYGARSCLMVEGKGTSRSESRFLSGLIASEVALALVLVAGAGLLAKDFLLRLNANTGLRPEHVLTFGLNTEWGSGETGRHIDAFYAELIARLRAVPGVRAAGAVHTLPMNGEYTGGWFEIEGRPMPGDRQQRSVQFYSATPGYLNAMGIPLLNGRDFSERDGSTSPPVAIISEKLARRFFAGENPVGRRIRVRTWWTIVGVAGQVEHNGAGLDADPQIYFPHAQTAGSRMWIVLRGDGDPSALTAAARSVVRSLDPGLPLLRVRTMRRVVSDSLRQPRMIAAFVAGFAAFALVLASLGIYGVIAYSVGRRTREMGVRMALGASSAGVLRLVLRKGALMALAGVALGLPAALGVSQALVPMLLRAQPRDAGVFFGTALVLIAAALAASYIPARRAARVNPAGALRAE
jgi:putative ABC transport system permease protein